MACHMVERVVDAEFRLQPQFALLGNEQHLVDMHSHSRLRPGVADGRDRVNTLEERALVGRNRQRIPAHRTNWNVDFRRRSGTPEPASTFLSWRRMLGFSTSMRRAASSSTRASSKTDQVWSSISHDGNLR
jgi:hypothetical protein